VLQVEGIGLRTVYITAEDGGIHINRDSTERTRSQVILAGDAGVNAQGELIDV